MKKLLIIILSITSLTSFSQTYVEVLQKFVANSPQLKQYKSTFTADSLSLRQGLNPLDPTVELEYFFKDGFDLSFKQQFDFPTLYHQRNMISKRGITKAQLEYKQNLLQLLLSANDIYQEYVYYSEMVELLKKRAEGLTRLDSLSQVALSKGALTSLEHKKTSILKNGAVTALNNAVNQLSNIVGSLAQMGVQINGKVDFENFSFNGTKEEFVEIVMAKDFAVEMLKMDSVIAVHKLKLAKQEWIPKLELGYKGSFGEGAIKHGLIAGISLPLWGNRNNVKYNKANIKMQSATIENVTSSMKVDFENLYDDYFTAKENCELWQDIDLSNYRTLMNKSFTVQSISSMEFLLELTSILDVQLEILNEKYTYAINSGRMAVYLMMN